LVVHVIDVENVFAFFILVTFFTFFDDFLFSVRFLNKKNLENLLSMQPNE